MFFTDQPDGPLENVTLLMQAHDYKAAELALNELFANGYADVTMQRALARCQLAQEKNADALYNYSLLLEESDVLSRAEAALVLNKTQDALPLLEAELPHRRQDADFLVLLAVTEYKLGFVQLCQEHLAAAVRNGLEWNDDDSLDFVLQQVLPMREFHDFEQLYLDAVARAEGQEAAPQNRWFSLNMPVYEIFSAVKVERQKQRAAELARLLSPHFDELYLSNGNSELRRILDDLARSQTDATFGIEARQAFQNNSLPEVARLILALELDHLQDFAGCFGLSKKIISESNLQKLIPLLPLRLAVGIIFLYTAGNPQDKLPNYNTSIDDSVMAGLLAACFISYYQQIEQYRSTTKKVDDI